MPAGVWALPVGQRRAGIAPVQEGHPGQCPIKHAQCLFVVFTWCKFDLVHYDYAGRGHEVVTERGCPASNTYEIRFDIRGGRLWDRQGV